MLRHAFEGYVPDQVLWRQKEQFSDGVGYAWIDSLKAMAEREVSDGMMRGAAERFPVKTPETKEAYVYRQIFEQHFPSASAVNCVPARAERRVQHADGPGVGRGIPEDGRPLGPRRGGRPPEGTAYLKGVLTGFRRGQRVSAC